MAMCVDRLQGGWLPGAVAAFLRVYTGPVGGDGRRPRDVPPGPNVEWVRRIELAFRPVVLGLLIASALGLLQVAAGKHWAAAAPTRPRRCSSP